MPDDDIVTILREDAVTAKEDYWHISPQTLIQAADEIERLRDALTEARRDGDERIRQQIRVTTERIAERDALAARLARLEAVERAARGTAYCLPSQSLQDQLVALREVIGALDRERSKTTALAATRKAGE